MVVVKKFVRNGTTYYKFEVERPDGKKEVIVTTNKKWAEEAAKASRIIKDEKGFIRKYYDVSVKPEKTKATILDTTKYGKKHQYAVASLLEKAEKQYDEYVKKLKSHKIVFTESEWKKLANKSAFAGRTDVVIVKDKQKFLKEVLEKGIVVKEVKREVKEITKPKEQKAGFYVKTAKGVMRVGALGQASVTKEQLEKAAEEQGFMIKEVHGRLEAVPIIQEYEVQTPEGKYTVIKNIKTGETKYKIGKAVWTEEELRKLATRPEFTYLRIMSFENPFGVREISTLAGGIISGQTDRAMKEIAEFQKQMVIKALLRAKQEWKGAAKNAAEAGAVTLSSIAAIAAGGGAFGPTVATATNVGFATMGAYTVSHALPKALETKSPSDIGDVLLGASMIASPIVAKVPVGKKSITIELKPTDVAIKTYKRTVRKGEYVRTGKVKIKTEDGAVLDGYLLEREVKLPNGRTVKERFIQLNKKNVKIGGKKVEIPEQKILVKDIHVKTQKLYETVSPQIRRVTLSEKFVSPEAIILDKDIIFRMHGIKEISTARISQLDMGLLVGQRAGKRIIRTQEKGKPATEISAVKYKEAIFKTENELLGKGVAKILSDSDKAFRELRYAVKEIEEKPVKGWGTIFRKVEKMRAKIETLKGRIFKKDITRTEKTSIRRGQEEIKPEKIFEEGDAIFSQMSKVRIKEDIIKIERTFEKLKTARRLGEVELKLKGAISTGNLGRILAFSPLRLLQRSLIIGALRRERIKLEEKQKTLVIKHEKIKSKNEQKMEEKTALELLTVNPLAQIEFEKTKLKTPTPAKLLTPKITETPNFFKPPAPLIPIVRIPKLPFVPLTFPKISEKKERKRIRMKKGVIKREFVTPEELLSVPSSLLSPFGFEQIKKKDKKEKSVRKKRIHMK